MKTNNEYYEYETNKKNLKIFNGMKKIKELSKENRLLKQRIAELEEREKNANVVCDVFEEYYEAKIEVPFYSK